MWSTSRNCNVDFRCILMNGGTLACFYHTMPLHRHAFVINRGRFPIVVQSVEVWGMQTIWKAGEGL